MPINVNGERYEIEREHLELLVERDNPTIWIAQALLDADNRRERNHTPSTESQEASA